MYVGVQYWPCSQAEVHLDGELAAVPTSSTWSYCQPLQRGCLTEAPKALHKFVLIHKHILTLYRVLQKKHHVRVFAVYPSIEHSDLGGRCHNAATANSCIFNCILTVSLISHVYYVFQRFYVSVSASGRKCTVPFPYEKPHAVRVINE